MGTKKEVLTHLSLHDQDSVAIYNGEEEKEKGRLFKYGRCCYNSGSLRYTASSIVMVEI
jgi:hypothetical protein